MKEGTFSPSGKRDISHLLNNRLDVFVSEHQPNSILPRTPRPPPFFFPFPTYHHLHSSIPCPLSISDDDSFKNLYQSHPPFAPHLDSKDLEFRNPTFDPAVPPFSGNIFYAPIPPREVEKKKPRWFLIVWYGKMKGESQGLLTDDDRGLCGLVREQFFGSSHQCHVCFMFRIRL